MRHSMQHPVGGDSLADILERVLDKGIVVAGDVSVSLVGIELLSIKLRLLITTVDKAMELGINWWETDPMLSSKANKLEDENQRLKGRLAILEKRITMLNAVQDHSAQHYASPPSVPTPSVATPSVATEHAPLAHSDLHNTGMAHPSTPNHHVQQTNIPHDEVAHPNMPHSDHQYSAPFPYDNTAFEKKEY